MGCAASKPLREGSGAHAHGEQWQKGSTSPTTPLPTQHPVQRAAAAATEDPNQAGSPTSSDASSYSHSSQLSTWDMRTMQGPIITTASASVSKKTADTAPTKPIIQLPETPLSTTVQPLSPSITAIQGSLPSFSQRMRSPSILGTPALDTPLTPPAPTPTERLTVTKIGGCTLINQYLVVQYLGRGTSGKVYLCIDVLDKRLYAVKIVKKTARVEKQLEEEEEEEEEEGETVGEDKDNDKDAAISESAANDAAPTASAGVDDHGDKKSYDTFAEKAQRLKEKAALRNNQQHIPRSTSTCSTSNKKKNPSSESNRNKNRNQSKSQRDPLIDLRREVEILRKVGSNHPNVVALREIVDDPTSNKMLIVMEYCEGGPVMTRAGLERGRRIPESVARPYFRDMIAALGYLHQNRVIHGDLKPENALMSANGRVALSDFGCSKILPDDHPKSDVVDRCNGTPAFLAPEMMTPGAKFRGRPADVYALGACLFTFIFGRIPFTAESVSELFKIVKTQELAFPDIPADASNEVKALLRGMLAKDPEARMALEKVAKHRWTTDHGRLPPVSLASSTPQENPSRTTTSTSSVLVDPHIVDGDASLAGLLATPGVEITSFLPGHVIVRQGDCSTSLMYIVQGEVEVLYRPSEEVMRGAAAQRNSSSRDGVGVANKEVKLKEEEGANNQKSGTSSGGGGGIGGAITKLWSPSARLKRSARDGNNVNTNTTTAIKTPIPSLDLNRFHSGGGGGLPPLPPAMLSARSAGTGTPRTGPSLSTGQPSAPSSTLVSPRERSLMLGLGTTPEPSPRFPIHSTATSTGALSTSFQLHQGLGVPTGGVGSHALDSAVTTPRHTTPLPSAREMESAGGGEPTGTIPQGPSQGDEREPTPFFTPLPSLPPPVPSNSNNDEGGQMAFSTPGNVLSPLSPLPTTATKTPGSGGSNLAAYPLTPKDMIESGDNDEDEHTNNTTTTTTTTPVVQGEGSAAGRAEATSSPFPPLSSALAAVPITTIHEEEEGGNIIRSSGLAVAAGSSSPGEQDGGAGASLPLPIARVDSGASWAPQAQLSRAFSSQTDAATSTFDIERENTTITTDGNEADGVAGRSSGGGGDTATADADANRSSSLKEKKKTTVIDVSSDAGSIPCALAEAAEEAGGFIQSLYRPTQSYNSKIGGSSGGAVDGEYLLAVRGAGDFIGETALIGGSSVRRSCSIRAARANKTAPAMTTTAAAVSNGGTAGTDMSESTITDSTSSDCVQVAMIPYSVAKEYLKTHPLAKQRLAEMVWSRQSEMIVLEGLLRLAGISRELHEEARKHIVEMQ